MEKDKIKSAIQEILGKEDNSNSESQVSNPGYLIKNILIVSTDYDYFILEEEGRLKDIFIQSYQNMEKDYIPLFTHSPEDKAIQAIQSRNYDIILFFNPPYDRDIINLAREIKKTANVPIVLVNRNTPESMKIYQENLDGPIDWVFTWSGDGKIFIYIVQFIEDMVNSRDLNFSEEADIIVIIENHPQYYSKFMYETQRIVSNYMEQVLHDELTWTQKITRINKRPRTLVALTIQEAKEIFSMHQKRIICMALGDLENETGPENSITEFIEYAKQESPSLPILIMSSESNLDENQSTVQYVDRSSPFFLAKFYDFINLGIGSTILVFYDGHGNEINRASDLKELEKSLWNIPDSVLISYCKDGVIIKWLNTIMENDLATSIEGLYLENMEIENLRKKIILELDRHRKSSHLGTVNNYSRSSYGSHSKFSRIGRGAMGGKARGLAFLDKLVSTYLSDGIIPNMEIHIPRTIVLCSDIFDSFIEDNGLLTEELFTLSDERIAQKFMEASLPPVVLGDLRSFIRETKVPLVVRSSSLLEDALHHPFAGVYSSLLLPNESWETDIRFQELCTAVKYVYASVFFQKARTYMSTIENNLEDEKMAVVIQELVGKKHGNIFYPTLSGVAKSYDFYPSGKCKSSDGVVSIALGLGKEIVDGGSAFRFCPIHPKSPKYGSQKDLLDMSQKEFYAVDLNSYVNIMQRDEDSTIKRYNISISEQHGVLDYVASTFDSRNERIIPGIGNDGMRVLDFAPIVQLETIELTKAVRLLLKTCEVAIGTPVEIEFALNIPEDTKKKPEFFPLQVRSMQLGDSMEETPIGEHSDDDILCYSENALGNGINDSIKDIVFVKRENYSLSLNPKIIKHIQKINKQLINQKTPYVLIGPGRWGSTDPWLGIPVTWSDIAGAKLIIETPVEERPIDPSQGSHFFHNMIAAKTAYFTILSRGKNSINWEWLEEQPSIEETEFIKHVKLDTPMEIRIDGRKSEGLLLKRKEVK